MINNGGGGGGEGGYKIEGDRQVKVYSLKKEGGGNVVFLVMVKGGGAQSVFEVVLTQDMRDQKVSTPL